jgi:hypothetical protein
MMAIAATPRHDRPMMLSTFLAIAPRPRPARGLVGAAVAGVALFLALALAAPASAQLGPGDLQRAHALTANTAGWVALRSAMRQVVEAAGIGGADPTETADTLAVLLALEDGGGSLNAIVIGAARAAMTAQASGDQDIARLFADQGLALARARAISCLIFGYAPDRFADHLDALGLTANEVEACPQAYARFRDHWLEIAAPLRAGAEASAREGEVELVPAAGAKASARAVLMAGRTLDDVGAFFATAIRSPDPIPIRALDCDRPDALPAPGEVRICYGLVAEIAAGIERGIIAEK